MKPVTLLIFLAICLLGDPLLAAPLVPHQRPEGTGMRLVERAWACHIGYGAPADWLKIDGEARALGDQQVPGWTGLNLSRAGYLGLGCLFGGYFLNYHFVDRAGLMDQTVTLEDQQWTAISYRLDQLTLGKSFSLAAHRLYLDLGLGGFVGSYQLSRPVDAENDRSEIHKDSGVLLETRLRLHLGRHFFLSYGLSGSSGLAALSARAGINFMMRY